ncbi:MAG TPA: homoserine dehydrogenase, partial [Methanobacterium sp.]|nr:homoserine dehydrogenase [Methanobacterium sp.]
MKICLMGFGSVGQGVARVFQMKKEEIKEEYGLNLELVAALDRSGAAVNSDGLDINLLLTTKQETGKVADYPKS